MPASSSRVKSGTPAHSELDTTPWIACAVTCTGSLENIGTASLRGRLLPARTDGKPDPPAQGAAGVGSHVVSQRDRQLGAARAPHRSVLADALRALSDPTDEPARPLRVRDASRAPDQDRGARDRTYRTYS